MGPARCLYNFLKADIRGPLDSILWAQVHPYWPHMQVRLRAQNCRNCLTRFWRGKNFRKINCCENLVYIPFNE